MAERTEPVIDEVGYETVDRDVEPAADESPVEPAVELPEPEDEPVGEHGDG
jgi:hypothetical protein